MYTMQQCMNSGWGLIEMTNYWATGIKIIPDTLGESCLRNAVSIWKSWEFILFYHFYKWNQNILQCILNTQVTRKVGKGKDAKLPQIGSVYRDFPRVTSVHCNYKSNDRHN